MSALALCLLWRNRIIAAIKAMVKVIIVGRRIVLFGVEDRPSNVDREAVEKVAGLR